MKSRIKFSYLFACLLVIYCQNQQDGLVTITDTKIEIRIATEKYVQSPEPTDSNCLFDIKRAKDELAIHPKIYVYNFGRGSQQVEYKQELDSLLKQNKFHIEEEPLSHYFEKGYTYQCFDEFIRWKMKQTYGDSVFLKLERQAEEIFQLKSLLPDK